MTIREIMTKDVITVKPSTTVQEVAQLFVERNISGAPVVDAHNKVVGIVLEEGVIFQDKKVHLPTFLSLSVGFLPVGAHRFEEELRKISATRVEAIMEKSFDSVSPDTSLDEAATLMLEKERYYLPVMEKEFLLGVLTKKDIVRAIAQGMR